MPYKQGWETLVIYYIEYNFYLYIEYNPYLNIGYNSFLNMGCKSLDMDYKSLFTKNLKIVSFTYSLQIRKILPE